MSSTPIFLQDFPIPDSITLTPRKNPFFPVFNKHDTDNVKDILLNIINFLNIVHFNNIPIPVHLQEFYQKEFLKRSFRNPDPKYHHYSKGKTLPALEAIIQYFLYNHDSTNPTHAHFINAILQWAQTIHKYETVYDLETSLQYYTFSPTDPIWNHLATVLAFIRNNEERYVELLN